jgi:hypothetical protein
MDTWTPFEEHKGMMNRTTDPSSRPSVGDHISFHSQICTEIDSHDKKPHRCTGLHQVLSCPRHGDGLKEHTVSILLISLQNYFGDQEWEKK